MSNDTNTDDSPERGSRDASPEPDDRTGREEPADPGSSPAGPARTESGAGSESEPSSPDADGGDETPADGPQEESEETPADTESRGTEATDPDEELEYLSGYPEEDADTDDAGARPAEASGAESEPDAVDSDAADSAEDEVVDRGDDSELGSAVDVTVNDDIEDDDLLGGLDVEDTEEIPIPDRLVDQVIGQENARDIIIKAAKQRRHVMMIGSPGTGKSMLAKAMTKLLPKEDLQDILVYHNPDDGNAPKVRTVPAGKGEQIIGAHREEAQKRNQLRMFLLLIVVGIIIAYTLLTSASILLGIIAVVAVYFLFRYTSRGTDAMVPNMIVDGSDSSTAPFEDATGAHAGALLGDVRHDPFQSGGMETPSHDRVEPGAIHKANKGVLFIDEINTLDVRSQQKLMTAIQEGEFSITGQSERSSGAMVQTEPVPCDFIMIAAGNRDALENMHPALRSRIKGYGYEVFMDDTIEDTPEMRRKYARFVAQEVENDGRLPHFTRDAVEEVVLEAKRRSGRKGHLTLHFRNLGGLVRVAGDIARAEDREFTTRDDVLQAKKRSRSIEQQLADTYIERYSDYDISMSQGEVVGRVNGLAVMGEDSGIVKPIMAEVTQGHGEVIATGKLQEIAQESVQNVSAIIKKLTNKNINEMDVHIQFLQSYEGVEGDSASISIATAVISALEDIPVDQRVAMTGSLSVRGDVLPVGGVTHKIEAAAKVGIDTVIIPAANEQDVMIEEEYEEMVDVIPVRHISEVLEIALVGEPEKDGIVDRLKQITGQAFKESQSQVTPGSSNPSPQ